MPLPARLQGFLDDLALFPDRGDRIQALITVGERFQEVPRDVATRPFDEAHRVPGCESEAFVWATRDTGSGIRLWFAVENPMGVSAKALAVILQENLDGESAAAISQVPDEIVYEVFGRELSMGKGLGLTNMVRAARDFAARA